MSRRRSKTRGRSWPRPSTGSASASSSSCANGNAQGLRELSRDTGAGDLPIFVSRTRPTCGPTPSCSCWTTGCSRRVVAGVPPDYFSADGQLWGNPVYDWDALRKTGYRWWIERLQAPLEYLDAIRIDHFRGFEAAWHVPAGAPDASRRPLGPRSGRRFLRQGAQALGGLPLLAEDLGVITPAVTALRDQFQLPGMRVLQFAFNGDPDNPHLPHHCVHNGVVYTGTHDNDTTCGWYDALPEHERRTLWNYLQRHLDSGGDVGTHPPGLVLGIRAGDRAVAGSARLGSESRMNVPGRAEGQWGWRCTDEALTDACWQRLHELTRASRRA